MGRFIATVEVGFSAAHALRGYQGDCERLHGHNWKVRASVASSEVDDLGMVMDFRKLKNILNGVIEGLDHRDISCIPPFDRINPSSELIAKYIFDSIEDEVAAAGCKLLRVEVAETPNSWALYEA